MDDVDRRIVAELRRDARATYAEVGGVVGLSAPAVKRRVDRLRDDGVLLGFTASVAPEAMGWGIEALVHVYCGGSVAPALLAAAWEPIPEIVSAWTVTGMADAVVRIRARDIAHLEETLERVRTSARVERTESTVVLSRLVERT